MKRNKILYWVFTLLFAALMIFSSVGDAISSEKAVKFVTDLGYPAYFVPFIGIAKLLGVVAILIPGFPRIKEWAYAGLFFDLISATYSIIVGSETPSGATFMLLPITLGILSYIFYHKTLKTSANNTP